MSCELKGTQASQIPTEFSTGQPRWPAMTGDIKVLVERQEVNVRCSPHAWQPAKSKRPDSVSPDVFGSQRSKADCYARPCRTIGQCLMLLYLRLTNQTKLGRQTIAINKRSGDASTHMMVFAKTSSAVFEFLGWFSINSYGCRMVLACHTKLSTIGRPLQMLPWSMVTPVKAGVP